MKVATLDFSNASSSSLEHRLDFSRQLVHAFKKYGFVKLTNHDVPITTVRKAFLLSQEFFGMPLEYKMQAPHPPTPNPHRGYSPIGLENTSSLSQYRATPNLDSDKGAQIQPTALLADMKESFDIGSPHDVMYNNIWPPPAPLVNFQSFMEDFFAACHAAQLRILTAIATGLDLPASSFNDFHSTQVNELRLTHYPTLPASTLRSGKTTRIAEHSDFGSITLLFQDQTGGLEVNDPDNPGHFFPVEVGSDDEVIVNIGDCMEHWTGGLLKSAKHRVHLPKALRDAAHDDVVPERFSIAFFGKPDREASLKPMKGFAVEGKKYLDITAGQFQQARLSSTY